LHFLRSARARLNPIQGIPVELATLHSKATLAFAFDGKAAGTCVVDPNAPQTILDFLPTAEGMMRTDATLREYYGIAF
jgi:hypothetical protein